VHDVYEVLSVHKVVSYSLFFLFDDVFCIRIYYNLFSKFVQIYSKTKSEIQYNKHNNTNNESSNK